MSGVSLQLLYGQKKINARILFRFYSNNSKYVGYNLALKDFLKSSLSLKTLP